MISIIFSAIISVRTYHYCKRKTYWILFAILLIAGSYGASAQKIDYLFRHLTTSNGLISNQVAQILQDSKGFIWIGTQTGLQRYDGKRFVTYLANVHDSTALHTDWISTMYEDSKKRLWIGTDQGAPYLLNRSTGKFYNFNLNISNNSGKMNGIWQFLEDRDGHIWVSAHNNYFKLNDVTNQFEPMDSLLQLGNRTLPSTFSIDKDGNLWFATTAGVKKLSYKKNILTDKNNNPDGLGLFDLDKPISSLVFDAHENMWISTGFTHTLYKYNFTSNKLSSYSFNKNTSGTFTAEKYNDPIGQVFVSSKGDLIVSLVARGLAIYNYTTDSFSIITAENNFPYALHLKPGTYSSLSMMEDAKNNIWIATDIGINIIDINKSAFVTYTRPSAEPGLLSSAEVSDFLQTKDGDIFVSYYVQNGGIARFDKELNFKKRYLFKEDESGNSNQLWNLFQDKDGIIWSPNQGGSILKLNPVNDELTVLKDSLLRGNINQIQQDKDSNIWIGQWSKGLMKIDGQTKKVSIFKNYYKPDLNPRRRATCFLFDGDKIWVGTAVNGLQVFDKKTETFVESFTLDEKNNQSISSNTITGIVAYNKDTLIVGTQGGINIFDKNKKIFTAITSKEGLPNNLVQAIVLDDDKNLWVAFYGGLCKINMQTFAVTNYDEDDGVINNRFNNRFLRLQDGRFMIGTSESFLVFDPAKITEVNIAPDVSITGFKVFDKNMEIDEVVNTDKEISLSYRDNSFNIEFASLQFSSLNKIKYFYQLTGVDKNWQQSNETQSVNYNQLQPGHYIFEVKSVNRNGVFSKNITRLSIHIIPPFWKTWWFITLLIVLLAAILFAVIKWRESKFKALEAGKTALQKMTAENYKTQFESEQISSFFTTSLLNKNDVDDVLWDVAKNLIGKLGLVDCMIYLWNGEKTKMIQKAGYGPKGSMEELEKQLFDVLPGQGIVGAVMQTEQPIIVADTSVDSRYRVDDLQRLSEICVPIKYNEQLLGVIDSEHYEKNFFTKHHLQTLTTIATLVASKIKSIEAEQRLRHQKAELADINQQLAEVQLAALRSQMNPHFIFNALNSIKKFVIANEPENAEKYLGKFSKLIRSILDNSQSGMVTVEKELQLLKLYLDLEQLRFGSKLTYSIVVDENIHSSDIEIPSMIVQPFVENAMLHGIMHREDGGKVDIHFLQHIDWLEITIEDNGVGRAKSAEYKSDNAEPHHSIGISVATKRLEVLKKNVDTPAGIQIIDVKNEAGEAAGTKVIIAIPTY